MFTSPLRDEKSELRVHENNNIIKIGGIMDASAKKQF